MPQSPKHPRLHEGKEWIAIVGPTGSGKSALALALAEALGGEIIGCDSVQLYRGFDIGSAKPSAVDQARIPHHLFDVFSWSEECDAALYASLAREKVCEVRARGRIPIVTGGTGLYLRALLGGGWNKDLPKDENLRASLQSQASDALYAQLQVLDARRASQLHPNDRFRVIRALELVTLLERPLHEAGLDASSPADQSAFIVVLDPPRPLLHERIRIRTDEMLASGLLEEVRSLLMAGVSPACKAMRSIGYKEAVSVLLGQVPESELGHFVSAATRQYAKRQCTWFRKVSADLRVETLDIASVLEALRSVWV